jgi:leader peptidase (prepilin peptidase) / N-methyltransferase
MGDACLLKAREEGSAGSGTRKAVDLAAGVVGLLVGLAVGPLADRVATNAPLHDPLLRRVPRSRAFLLVTVATTALAAAACLVFGFTLEAAIAAVFCWVLVVVTRTDIEHRLIPDLIVLPGAVLMVLGRTVDDPSVEWILSAVGAGLFLLLLVFVYPSGIGMGDVKLAVFLGAGLGVSVVVALFLGFFAAFVPALVLFVRRGRAIRGQAIPFGPFLALGAVIALFAGDALLDWYVELGTGG